MGRHEGVADRLVRGILVVNVLVVLVVETLQFHVRQDGDGPIGENAVCAIAAVVDCAGRKAAPRVVVALQGQSDLLEIVAALHSLRSFARRLHGREQKRDQDADDRNDDQQLN